MRPINKAFRFVAVLAALILALELPAGQQSPDSPDLDMMNKIRFEGLRHSGVAKLAAYLSDVIGPRPTGSPAIARANAWAAESCSISRPSRCRRPSPPTRAGTTRPA